MALADLLKTWFSGVSAGGIGESILYRGHPSQVFRTINAVVRKNPVDVQGEVLQNGLEVWISKTDVAAVTVGRDEIRLPADKEIGKAPVTWRVDQLLRQDGGHWHLSCVE